MGRVASSPLAPFGRPFAALDKHAELPYKAAVTHRPGLVTTVAIVNIVFGVVCGCLSLGTMALPTVMEKIGAYAENLQKDMSAKMRQIEEEARNAITDPAERKRLDEQFGRYQSPPMPDMRKFSRAFFTPPVKEFFVIAGAVDGTIKLIFLISGIGLLCMARWAKKLAIGASIASIVVALPSPFVARAFIGDVFTGEEFTQAMKSVDAELAQYLHERIASLEKNLQEMEADMEKNPQTATPEMKESLERAKSALETAKKMSAVAEQTSSKPGLDSAAGFLGLLWEAFWVLLVCAWPVACILMLRTAKVRAAFADPQRLASP
jgi:hypothetical protein